MAIDPYAACPCGSGKKFKWCCQPVHEELAKVFALDEKGQHEAALRAIDDVIKDHPDNPEVWGRKALLLFQIERAEDAEAALQKAFDINPNYAFGLYLKGKFRQFEGEVRGALSLFRKAVELYDPSAGELIAEIYGEIAQCESMLNRPLATRAALQFVERYTTSKPEVRQAIAQAYGENSQLPLAARRTYTFMPPSSSLAPEQQRAWQEALERAASGKLSDASAAFEELTRQMEDEPAAWYNLALCRAWAGANAASLEALARYVELETDEARAADAWALGEVLRFGQGMEDQADCVRYTIVFPISNPDPLVQFLQQLAAENRLVAPRNDPETRIFSTMVLEKGQALMPQGMTPSMHRQAAQMVVHSNVLQLWNTNQGALDAFAQEMTSRIGSVLGQPLLSRGPANFGEAFSEAMAFPVGFTDAEEANRRMEQEVARYYEETWPHRPLKSLNQIAPIDAAPHAQLRKKLLGVIQLLEHSGARMQLPYNFDRLRRKLGLSGGEAAAAGTAAADISAMSAAELSSLNAGELSDADAEQAYQAAMKLDARELAAQFAKALVSRPAGAAKADRFPWYNNLVQQALREDDYVAALNYINEGESYDCDHNEGKRRNDFEIRRAQVHARSGEIDQAEQVFERLIARDPDDLRIRGTAAEAMLSARQTARALRFAEEGLNQARQKNKRDSEEYFQELVAAAQKQS